MINYILGALSGLVMVYAVFQASRTFIKARSSRLFKSSSLIIYCAIGLLSYLLSINLKLINFNLLIYTLYFFIFNLLLHNYWKIAYRQEGRSAFDIINLLLVVQILLFTLNNFSIFESSLLGIVVNYNILNFSIFLINIYHFVKDRNISLMRESSFTVLIYLALFLILIGQIVSTPTMGLVFILFGSLLVSLLAYIFWDMLRASPYFWFWLTMIVFCINL